jgi:hypothetical protein
MSPAETHKNGMTDVDVAIVGGKLLSGVVWIPFSNWAVC